MASVNGCRSPHWLLSVVDSFYWDGPWARYFPVRLATLHLAETTQPAIFLWALLFLFTATLGLIRLLRALTQPLNGQQLQREPSRLVWIILPLLIIGVILSLNPALLDPVTAQIADWMTQL